MGHGPGRPTIHVCDKSGKLAGAAAGGRKLARRLRIRHMDQAQRQLRATFNLKCFSGGREGGGNNNCKHETETENENERTKPKPKT